MIRLFSYPRISTRLTVALLLACTLSCLSFLGFAGRAHAEGGSCGTPFSECYIHTATSSNIVGASTYIDDPTLNNHPGLLLFIVPNWNPPGAPTRIYNPHPIGIIYDTGRNQYAIFNEDLAPMPINAVFNVGVAGSGAPAFSQAVTSEDVDSTSTSMYLDTSLTNNNPNAVLIVTQNADFKPDPTSKGVINNDTISVWYDTSVNKWAIFNNSTASGALRPLPLGAAFNVLVMSPSFAIVHVSTASNSSGDFTLMNYPGAHLNSMPGDILFVTPRYVPGTYAFDTAPLGVWYTGSLWSIFNEDGSPMPINMTFNVVAFVFGTY